MGDNTDLGPPKFDIPSVSDVPHAPFIFYDGAAAFGHVNGVIGVTLAANRTWIGPDGGIRNDQVVVAYLRGNIEAAKSLRQALDDALLLAVPAQGQTN